MEVGGRVKLNVEDGSVLVKENVYENENNSLQGYA